MKLKTLTQTYNDGVAKIYSVSTSGNMPRKELTLRLTNSLPYEERMVGMSRYWAALQEQTRIERLLRMPRNDAVEREDVVIPIDGQQYVIKQIQYPPDVEPKSMDLSLEKVQVAYAIK